MYTRVRVAALAVALAGLITASLAAVPADAARTRPAAKASSLSLTWHAAATTTAKKLNQRIVFPSTTFTATVVPTARTLSGPLVLPPATSSVRLGRLDLVKITLQVADPSPVSGTVGIKGTVWTISARQTFRVRITKVTGPAGLVNLVRPGCTTARTTATLDGTIDFAKGAKPGGPSDYTVSGSYTIPRFTGCGLLMSPLLTSLVSGPGNPLSVHFTS